MTVIEAAAIEAARAYGLQLRTVPDWNDEDGGEWARAARAGREQFLTALAALSDADALRVIRGNLGVEPDGETPFELVKVHEVQAWRERPDSSG
ncbi:TPA: hypothetical protein ACUNF5_006727 [Burkholderia orbicola]|uniref:Uncharacterized protein n=1 Tax=Burkholderia cenocepacia TaxID=95486 RepID=A0AAW4TQB5_9BURK|nr:MULTISPECIES: hypothetical protein [Burkholderia cepacia complex]MCA8383573.1 hypothetical protein [Burkholderia cenocepacia]MDN7533986.1 hypothetical protein [Burkholderia orbicola]